MPGGELRSIVMRQRRTEARIVGRDADIDRVLDLAAEPAVGAVLLTGPTGVGTSRLAEAAMSALAERGWHGVGLSATDPAADIAFAALSELIPDTLDRLSELDAHAADIAVLRALEDALDAEGHERAVVVIDELASTDEPSCNVLVHLATNRRIFIVASQSSGPGVAEALRRLAAAGVKELAVEPLDLPATAELAASLLGDQVDPGLVREIWDRSRGWPLIIAELVSTGRADGAIRPHGQVFQLAGQLQVSPSLGRQILQRLAVLTGDERAALEMLAIAGELDIDDLARLVDEAVLDELDRRDVIDIDDTGAVATGLRVRLAHPILAEAVVADMTALALRRRHRELAELLALAARSTPRDEVLLAIARVGGGQDIEIDELLTAARTALRLDRIRDAGQLAEAAFGRAADDSTREMLAEARVRGGRFVEADRLLADNADQDDDWTRMRRAIRRSSNQLWGFRDAAAAWRIDADCIPMLSDPDAIDRVVAHQAWIAYCDGRSDEAISITDGLLHVLAEDGHPDVRFAVAAARAPALVLAGRVEDGIALARRAWDGEWGADTEYGSHGQHLIALGFGHLYLGELESARWLVGEAIRICRERSETTALLFFLDLAGWSELLGGEIEAAASFFSEAATIATGLAITASVSASLAGLAIARAQTGGVEATAAAWHRLLDVPDAPGPRVDYEQGAGEAWHIATSGDPAKAAELLRRAADRCGARGLRTVELLALLDIARLGYATVDDAGRAAWAADRCQGPLLPLIADAVTAAAVRDGGRLLAVATAFAERGFALPAAEFAALAADAGSAAGDQKSAAAAQALSARMRARVAGANTPLLQRALSVEPLTRREREIAGRAASGASNADIAGQLHVSVRTVETHLQRVYRKLGVSSRQELGELLDD